MQAAAWDQFGEALARCGAAEDAWTLFTRTVADLGYHSVDYGLARLRTPAPAGPEDLEIVHHLATNDWSARYLERGYQAHDRLTRRALHSLLPYSYAAEWEKPHESALQREMEHDIAHHEVHSGLNIPLHGPGPVFAAVSLGSRLPDAERRRLERETLPAVHLISALFNERMHALLGRPGSEAVALSARERECLLWAGRGKTAWECARILSLSESAVRKHLASAARKLNARTRAQAVAAAVARGLIRP